MKKFILIPDSFKGTLSSKKVCDIMRERILAHYPLAEVLSIPVADGGEGSVECFLSAVGGELIRCETKNPFFEDMEAFFGLINGTKTAVVELAACAGLPLVEDRKNPMRATTYGVGILIREALCRGVEEIILALGGSATNDFGCGLASALGVKFYDEAGKDFIPVGESLSRVARIEMGENILKNVKLSVMCDVKNPVFGENGAAYVYAPQKGANEEEVRILDDGLRHICEIVKRDLALALGTDQKRTAQCFLQRLEPGAQ